jgi:hypothetical protein
MSPVATKLPLRAAMEAHDRRAVVEAFTEDAVLRSPFTDNLVFEGRDQLDALVSVILHVLEDFTYTAELHGDHEAVLVGSARVDGLRLQFSDFLRLDDDGLVEEMTVFFRPLPATTAAMRRIGEGLARRKSPLRARAINLMAAPMARMARTGDRLAVGLIKP